MFLADASRPRCEAQTNVERGQSLWTGAVPSEEARWGARAAGWFPGAPVRWELRCKAILNPASAVFALARRAPLLARAAPFLEPSLLSVALEAGARLLAAEAPRGGAPDAFELGATLTLLASCTRPPEAPDDVLSQRTWVTLFSTTWWPALRALPPGKLVRAWRAAAALELDEATVLPLAEEAAQRGANEGAEARRENWGDERDAGSLAAAAAHVYAARVAPFLELLQGRHVHQSVLHSDFEEGFECHRHTLSLNPAEWFGCTCSDPLLAGLATWGAPTLPPSLLLWDIEEAEKKARVAARLAKDAAAAAPAATAPVPEALAAAAPDALAAPAPDAPAPGASAPTASAPASPTPMPEPNGDNRISLGWTVALGARGMRAGGLRSIRWLAAFGHKAAAKEMLVEYVRRCDVGGAEAERDCSEFNEFDTDLFTGIVTSVALTGSVERAQWAVGLVGNLKTIDPQPATAAARAVARAKLLQGFALKVLAPAGRAGHLLLMEWGAERGRLSALPVREYETETRLKIEEALRGGCRPILNFWLDQERRVWTRPEHDFALSFRPDSLDDFDKESGTYGYINDSFFLAPGVLRWAANAGVARHFQESVLLGAAIVGDLDGLDAVLTRPFSGQFHVDSCAALPAVVAQAARSGHMELLEWLVAKGAPFDARAFFAAAIADEAGDAGLQCLLTSKQPPVLSYDEQCKVLAACFNPGYRDFDIVRAKVVVLRGAGFAWDARTYDAVKPVEPSLPAALTFLLAEGCPRGDAGTQAAIITALVKRLNHRNHHCSAAVATKSVELLLDAGFPLVVETFTEACAGTSSQSVALLDVLFERSCAYDSAAATLAAVRRGPPWTSPPWCFSRGMCFAKESIAVLTWLEEHNMLALSPAVAADAAKQMSLDLIVWLTARGCPLDASFAAAAVACAKGGRLVRGTCSLYDEADIAAAELAFLDAVLALRPPLDVSVARAAARVAFSGEPRAVKTAIAALERLLEAGCAIDASAAFAPPSTARGTTHLAVMPVVRWLCERGGVPLAAMGAGACACYEECVRQQRRQVKGAKRQSFDHACAEHREWLVARGCGCGGAVHTGVGAPTADALCYVCRDELLPVHAGAPPLADCDACGAYAHQPCVDQWLASCGETKTCAHCRAPWVPGGGWPPPPGGAAPV